MGQAGVMALQIGGTVIGSYFGGPIGGMIGGMAGGLIGGALFGRSKRPLITDTQLGNASFGNPIPILYGTARLPGQMVWTTVPEVKGGGAAKGGMTGGASQIHIHQSAMFLFCEPGLAGSARLQTIWLDGKLFWQSSAPNAEVVLSRHTFEIREYTGAEDQQPDPAYASWVLTYVAVHNAIPAYRGRCLVAMHDVDTTNYGNRFPQVTATWTTNGVNAVSLRELPLPVGVPLLNRVSTAVDWVRGNVYVLYSDYTIRGFSIATGQCFATIAEADYGPGLGAPIAAGIASGGALVEVLACGQGGGLYVLGQQTLANLWGVQLDPNTLRAEGPPTYITTGSDSAVDNDPIVTVIPVVGLTGARELLVLHGGYHIAPDFLTSSFVMVTPTGLASVFTDPALTGLQGEPWGTFRIAQGKQDTAAGTTEIWVTYVSLFKNELRVHHFFTDGLTVSGGELRATLDGVGVFGYAGSAGDELAQVWYDPSDDALLILYGAALAKWSATGGVLWTKNAGLQTLEDRSYQVGGPLEGGQAALTSISTASPFVLIDASTGDAVQYALQGSTVLQTRGYSAFDPVHRRVLVNGVDNQLYIGYFGVASSGGVAVGDIILDLCKRVGMTVDMVDVSALTQQVSGYVVRDTRSAGQAIKDLLDVFQIDMVESDWTLKFVPRGRASVGTLTEDQLGSIDPQDPSRHWEAQTAPEQEMPLLLSVKYPDVALNFQPGSAYARRIALNSAQTMWAKRRLTVDLPIVCDNLTARQIAESWLYTLWAERTTFQTALSASYLWLDPTDNITVNLNSGDSYTVRVESVQAGADYALALQCASEDISAYAPSTTPGATVQVPPLPVPGFVSLLQFNAPLLQDSDDLGGRLTRVYYAATAQSGAFSGATIYKSTDGSNFAVVNGLALGATVGTARNVLGPPPSLYATDQVNTLTVVFPPGTTLPSSAAYADLMNAANPCLVGAEVLQFSTVSDNADGSVTLSGLIRGLRGTDWAVDGHQPSETVLLLAAGHIGAGALNLTEINQSESWKIVPPGATLGNQISNRFTYLGYDLMPYAPLRVQGAYDGSSNIVLSWIRQSRIGATGMVDGTDTIPLGETSEAYSVDVMDATNVTVIRTINALSSPAATYTAAQITTDWGSPPATLWVRVYQISSVVGRGFSHAWKLDLAGGVELTDRGDPPPIAVVV